MAPETDPPDTAVAPALALATGEAAPPVALLLTDLVDSAALAAELGDAAMTPVWTAHDRVARDLLRRWRGHEIDKSDGFLLLFGSAADAVGYAVDYHRAIGAIALPGGRRLAARAGLHVGQVTIRESSADDVALGAKPFEVDGVSKPLAARVMSTALGGQTLLTKAALQALGPSTHRSVSHGFWAVKGLPAPIELFEVGDEGSPFQPPPDSAKVWRVVRQGDLWLPLKQVRHTLPAERDAFVGRKDALASLAQRFDDGARLVSVLGVGGTGKTRLATRFGWRQLGHWPGGVWFCDLAPARTLEGLASAVAQGLELRLGQDDPVQQIGQALAARGRCLVVLDTFEHVARMAEASLGHWLDRAAEAAFLVTTREVLGIPGEQMLALAPLAGADAEALFWKRAAAARRDGEPSADDRAAVASLVALLDGLPLAIELAAARSRTLAPRSLLARMSERFKLLSSAGGRQDRQATLRATFDWSWGLLPTAEKMALAQLAVFEGGFTLDAVEGVVDLSALDDPPWTLDALNALVDKSFVRALGHDRFELLGSVQAYAAEHLLSEGRFSGSGPAAWAAAERRHGQWFASLPRPAAEAGGGTELDNLAAACRRAVARGDGAVAVGTLVLAWAALNLRGPYKAAVDLAEPVAAMAGLTGGERARALSVLGHALEASGRRAQAFDAFARASDAAREAGDDATAAAVAVRLANLHARAGRREEAVREGAEALELARRIGDAPLECAALNGLGVLAFEGGEVERGRTLYEQALSLARQLGERRLEGTLLGNLGNLHASLGELETAESYAEAALAVLHALGDRTREGMTWVNLGMLRWMRGEVATASAALADGLAAAREVGHRRLECIALGNLGLVSDALDRRDEAIAQLDGALAIAREVGDRRSVGQFLGHRGLAEARAGRIDTGRAWLDEAAATLTALGDRLSLGLVFVQRAALEQLAGDAAAAAEARAAGEAIARECDAGPRSELGLALARLS